MGTDMKAIRRIIMAVTFWYGALSLLVALLALTEALPRFNWLIGWMLFTWVVPQAWMGVITIGLLILGIYTVLAVTFFVNASILFVARKMGKRKKG